MGVNMNESVAWMHKDLKDGWLSCTNQHPETEINDWIPLYTHPAKTLAEPPVKEITDLWLDVINNIPANDKRPREWHFANAILRKAQE